METISFSYADTYVTLGLHAISFAYVYAYAYAYVAV